jgi:hypothetical protein
MKKLFLIAFVVSGLAFAAVQHSEAQVYGGTPANQGIGAGPGINWGYPHFESGFYPRGGYYYQQPDSGSYRAPSSYSQGQRGYSRHHRQDVLLGPLS